EVSVATWDALPLVDGRFALELSTSTVHVPCDPDDVENVVVAHDADLLALEIDFELISATEPSEPFCVVDEAAGTMNIRGQLLTARLVHLGTDDVVCEVKTTRAKERAVRMNTGDSRDKEMRPEVEVTKIEPVGGANLDGDL